MSMYKKQSATTIYIPSSAEGTLRNFVDKLCSDWRNGINMADKGQPTFHLKQNHEMREEVIDLGLTLIKSHGIDFKLWAYWMMNSYFYVGDQAVTFFQRGIFFNKYTEDKLGAVLQSHFDKPIIFKVDSQLDELVRYAA